MCYDYYQQNSSRVFLLQLCALRSLVGVFIVFACEYVGRSSFELRAHFDEKRKKKHTKLFNAHTRAAEKICVYGAET